MNSPTLHAIQWAAASVAVFIAQTVPDIASGDWFVTVERLGLAVALVVFFVWTGWQREARMAKRIDTLEKDNKTLATKTAQLAEQVSQSMNAETSTIARAIEILALRPCYACSREMFEAWVNERLAREGAK